MITVQVTMKKDGENYIVENNIGGRWEFKLERKESDQATKAGFANLAASMLTATIVDSLKEDSQEVKFQLSVI